MKAAFPALFLPEASFSFFSEIKGHWWLSLRAVLTSQQWTVAGSRSCEQWGTDLKRATWKELWSEVKIQVIRFWYLQVKKNWTGSRILIQGSKKITELRFFFNGRVALEMAVSSLTVGQCMEELSKRERMSKQAFSLGLSLTSLVYEHLAQHLITQVQCSQVHST